jgi:hypothetical protein
MITPTNGIMTHGTLRFTLIALLCFTTLAMQAQKKGFVSTVDNVYQQGRILYDQEDPTKVRLNITAQETVEYTPKDLKRFGYLRFLGFGDSTIYESARIPVNGNEQDLFLKQLVGGSEGLLEYEQKEHRFFYRNEQGVKELTKSNFRDILNEVANGKPFWVFQTAKVRFNRTHLTLFFQAVNFGLRTQINFPRLQVQASSINGNLKLNGLNDAGSPLIGTPMSLEEFGVGISYYEPIKNSTRLGITFGLSYEEYTVVATRSTGLVDKDLLTGFDRFLLEFAPTYKLSFGRVVPSIFAGGSIALSTNQTSELFEATAINNSIVFYSQADPVRQPKYQGGIMLGANIDFLLTPMIVTSVSYSYNAAALNAANFQSLNTTKITLKIGL